LKRSGLRLLKYAALDAEDGGLRFEAGQELFCAAYVAKHMPLRAVVWRASDLSPIGCDFPPAR
jgi:hypothetical protein